jgi:glycosyltransferase involved in cell wall biosynthesis
MRVALVIAGPYPSPRGSQVLVSHLAAGLGRRGHDVRVVSYGPGRCERPGPPPARLGGDAMLLARLWRVARRERVDVLHAHNYEAAIAALVVGRVTGRPVVYHGHSAHAAELPLYASRPAARRWLARLGGLLDRHVPRRADCCIAVSAGLADRLRTAGLPSRDLVCLEPASPPDELDDDWAGPGQDAVACYAGNLDAYQDVEHLLRAFASVRAAAPEARLRLVSHADARGHAARLAVRGLGPGVEVVLAGSYDEVRTELRRAAVAVCPRTEGSGFPMKLLTYMAMGKAIVASAGSAKNLVDGVTARVVPDGDTGAFADALRSLLWDAVARERLGRAARGAAQGGEAWDEGLTRIEAIYRRLLTNNTE